MQFEIFPILGDFKNNASISLINVYRFFVKINFKICN